MNDEAAMNALMAIEGFRNLNADLETIINRSEQIKDAKRKAGEGDEPSAADFERLVSLGVFNSGLMNDAVWKFRRYEDASLRYMGVSRHSGRKWDCSIRR